MRTVANTMQEWIQYFGNHFVTFESVYESPGKDGAAPTAEVFIVSAFLIESHGYWFFMTTGHVFPMITEARKQGIKFGPWRLCDHWGLDRKHDEPIPIEFENLIRFVYYRPSEEDAIATQKSGFDYVTIPVPSYFVRHMAANNLRPIDARAWGSLEENYDGYMMLGVPAQLCGPTSLGNREAAVKRQLVVIPVERHAVPPPEMERKYKSFYGRIPKPFTLTESEPITDIKGMSGGPIFGLDFKENRYFLIAMQSSWNPKTGNMLASPCWSSLGT